MALTRLGWDVLTSGSSSRLTNLRWITGKVRSGDAHTILDELGRRFNSEVEAIRKEWSWGYAYRNVRGASIHSEHSAGTAVDFNAPKHPLGASGTFNKAQYAAIRRILNDLDGAVRFGGDYAGRKDEMHFELQGGVAKLRAVANKIKGNVTPTVSKPPVKAPAKAPAKASGQPTDYAKLIVDGDFGPVTVKAVQIVMRAIKTYSRDVDGGAGVHTWKAVQEWLQGLGCYPANKYLIDGKPGAATIEALQTFLVNKGHLDGRKWLIDGKLGKQTVMAWQRYLNTQR